MFGKWDIFRPNVRFGSILSEHVRRSVDPYLLGISYNVVGVFSSLSLITRWNIAISIDGMVDGDWCYLQ